MNCINFKKPIIDLVLICLVIAFPITKIRATDKFIFAVPNEFVYDHIFPFESISASERFILQLIYEPLILTTLNQNIKGVIAESWNFNNRENYVDFKIRNDCYFSDGSQCTVEDIETSFKILCAENNSSSKDISSVKNCGKKNQDVGVKIIDANTVRFFIDSSPSFFLRQISSSRAVIFKKVNNQYIGSGQFKLTKIQNHNLADFEVNTFYKKNRNFSSPFQLQTVFEDDLPTEIKKHRVDGAFMYLDKYGDNIFAKENYQIRLEDPHLTLSFIPNTKKYPFNNDKLRKWVHREIAAANMYSQCYRLEQKPRGIVPYGLAGSIANTAKESAVKGNDAAMEKNLPPSKIVVALQTGKKNDCLFHTLEEIFKKINVTVNFKVVDSYKDLWPEYSSGVNDGIIEYQAFKNREAYTIYQYYLNDSKENLAQLSDVELSRMITQSQNEVTSKKRYEIYKSINQYIDDHAYTFPIFYQKHFSIFKSCINIEGEAMGFNPFLLLLDIKSNHPC